MKHKHLYGVDKQGNKICPVCSNDMPKLDLYENQVFYNLKSKGYDKKTALKLLINQIEGDASQLSKGLLAYAKKERLLC